MMFALVSILSVGQVTIANTKRPTAARGTRSSCPRSEIDGKSPRLSSASAAGRREAVPRAQGFIPAAAYQGRNTHDFPGIFGAGNTRTARRTQEAVFRLGGKRRARPGSTPRRRASFAFSISAHSDGAGCEAGHGPMRNHYRAPRASRIDIGSNVFRGCGHALGHGCRIARQCACSYRFR